MEIHGNCNPTLFLPYTTPLLKHRAIAAAPGSGFGRLVQRQTPMWLWGPHILKPLVSPTYSESCVPLVGGSRVALPSGQPVLFGPFCLPRKDSCSRRQKIFLLHCRYFFCRCSFACGQKASRGTRPPEFHSGEKNMQGAYFGCQGFPSSSVSLSASCTFFAFPMSFIPGFPSLCTRDFPHRLLGSFRIRHWKHAGSPQTRDDTSLRSVIPRGSKWLGAWPGRHFLINMQIMKCQHAPTLLKATIVFPSPTYCP